MAGITLENVAKIYADGSTAVSDFSLAIEDGEFVVLVGPSGCGKTTLLRMVAGLEPITSGEVRIGDRVVNDMRARDRDIAMVFQNYALYPHMTVYENMAFGLKLRKVDRTEIDRRVREAARILGLDELLKRKPRALSGGQRQRVAMGRAIVREPQAFLMDEPLSNLDAKLRVQMRAEIARIQRQLETTTIYVTHDQTEAMTMGDRVAVMRKGVLQQIDAPEVLYDSPVNLFVAGFIGSPAMNLTEARVTGSGAGMSVEFGGHSLKLDEQALAAHPALRAYDGKDVILGIRPEAMQDATLVPEAPAERRISATVDLREVLGSHILVHFMVQTPPVLTDETKELSPTSNEGLEPHGSSEESKFVAQLDPKSKVREREAIDLVVDTARLHFFDPANGRGIYE